MADAVVERKVKPEKPDEGKFQSELAQLQKDHEVMMKKLNEVKGKLELSKPAGANGAQNPAQQRQSALRKELREIQATQSTKKSSKQTLLDRQKAINESINAKIASQKSARAKIPFKSPEEVEAEISRLESQVETGTLKLVDERRILDEISALRKKKKGFAGFDDSQAEIDKLKASLADIRQQLDDPEAKALSDRFTEITTELDSIKGEQDGVFQNLNSLRDERTKYQKEQQEKFGEIKALKDAYYTAKNAHREYEQEAYKIKREKRKAEQEAYEKKKKMEVASQLLEDASFKAFISEIQTCEKLIAVFDPDSATKKADGGPVSQFQAPVGRTITEEPKGMTVLKKKEEDYFIGGSSSKKKGGKKNTPPAKFSLSIGILEELGKVDVPAPTRPEDLPSIVEKLKAKIQYYQDNQERVTKENIEKAKAKVDSLEDGVADLSVEESKAE